MMKIVAVAVLAMATCADALECVPEYGQCYGGDEPMTCCEGSSCVKRDEFYGQCLPEGAAVPPGWVRVKGDGVEMDVMDDLTDGMTDSGMPKAADDMTVDEMDDLKRTEGPESAEKPADVNATMPLAPKEGPKMALEPQGSVAMGPGSDDMPIYMAFEGKDYLPGGPTPKKVMVQDLEPASSAGHVVMSQEECEDLCTSAPKCNAASFYLDAEPLGGMNCWLKTIADPCELPLDADVDPNSILLLKSDDTCTSMMPQSSMALAPKGIDTGGLSPGAPQGPQAKAPLEAGTKSVSAGMEVTPPPSSAVSLHSTVLAMALAGAVIAMV